MEPERIAFYRDEIEKYRKIRPIFKELTKKIEEISKLLNLDREE